MILKNVHTKSPGYFPLPCPSNILRLRHLALVLTCVLVLFSQTLGSCVVEPIKKTWRADPIPSVLDDSFSCLPGELMKQ